MLQQASARRARFRWFAGAADPLPAAIRPTMTRPALANAVFRALVGGVAVFLIVRLEIGEPPAVALAALVGGAWLCLASVFDIATRVLMRLAAPLRRGPSIPLRFAGSTGRFVLRRLGRSRVEVRAGSEIVAELVADHGGDELVIYDVASISPAELPELGSAIGQAMQIAALAARGAGRRTPFE